MAKTVKKKSSTKPATAGAALTAPAGACPRPVATPNVGRVVQSLIDADGATVVTARKIAQGTFCVTSDIDP